MSTLTLIKFTKTLYYSKVEAKTEYAIDEVWTITRPLYAGTGSNQLTTVQYLEKQKLLAKGF